MCCSLCDVAISNGLLTLRRPNAVESISCQKFMMKSDVYDQLTLRRMFSAPLCLLNNVFTFFYSCHVFNVLKQFFSVFLYKKAKTLHTV